MRHLCAAVVILAFAFPAGGSARAQQSLQSSDTIPKELVSLLLRGPGTNPGDNFDIKIGAPANFPSELLPQGVAPAVSTTSDRVITVVAEAPAISSADLLQHERALAAAGWINTTSMSSRGLISSSMMPAMQVCKGDQYATLYHSQRPAGGMYLRVSLTTDPRRGSCVPRPLTFFADVNLPQLVPPPGSRAMGGGSGGGGDSYDQRIRLETTLSVEDVVAHYSGQLARAGWKREARADDSGVALAKLTSISSTQDPIVALITATTIPGVTQLDVTLRLLRVDPSRRFPGRVGGPGIGGSITIGTCCR
ncbi:MAG: hypothetical protein WD690_11950 [Vicinamibacterales bacterium]